MLLKGLLVYTGSFGLSYQIDGCDCPPVANFNCDHVSVFDSLRMAA